MSMRETNVARLGATKTRCASTSRLTASCTGVRETPMRAARSGSRRMEPGGMYSIWMLWSSTR